MYYVFRRVCWTLQHWCRRIGRVIYKTKIDRENVPPKPNRRGSSDREPAMEQPCYITTVVISAWSTVNVTAIELGQRKFGSGYIIVVRASYSVVHARSHALRRQECGSCSMKVKSRLAAACVQDERLTFTFIPPSQSMFAPLLRYAYDWVGERFLNKTSCDDPVNRISAVRTLSVCTRWVRIRNNT